MDRPAETARTETATVAPPESRFPVFFRLARGFWAGPTAVRAWLLTLGVILFALANLAAAVGVNRWHKFFFDALERKDVGSVLWGVAIILGLVVLTAAVAAGLVHMRMRLQVRWREWLTGQLIRRWLSERRFYQLSIVEGEDSHPEFRIADDTRYAIEPLVDFIVGLTNALLAAVTFIGILWAVGGAIRVFGVVVPGYMVWAAIAYTALTSAGMVLVGRPLVLRVEERNAGEARLRYELTRVRDSAESIAMIGGDEDERARLRETFADLASRWLKVIVQQARMTWIGNGNAVLAPVLPLLLGAPKYLAGDMSLGTLMQAVAAFTQVHIALNWLVENAIRLAEWFASAHRVVQLVEALDLLDATIGRHGTSEMINLGTAPDRAIHLKNLSIAHKDGKLMLDGTDATIEPGEKVLVKGESGAGKSTLIRAMAGLWPWGSGEILRPKDARIAFIPQRPYLPLGTLRNVIRYPQGDREIDEAKIRDVMKEVGLSHLIPRLDDEDQWSGILSGGEQQRLAFARLLIDPPDVIVMDESTSALDEVSQRRMLEFLRTDLVHATVIHVAHRPGLEEFHDREIHLVRVEGGPAVAHDRRYPWPKTLLARLLRRVLPPASNVET